MANAAGTIVSQKGYNGSWYEYNTTEAHYIGFNYNSLMYPYILQFITPTFTGESTSINFSLSLTCGNRNNSASSMVSFRYAILKSDANKDSYRTTAAVSDTNQITSGTTSFTGLTAAYQSVNLNIATSALESNTTYYLIMWGDNSGGYQQDYAIANTAGNHSVELWYNEAYAVQVVHYLCNANGSYTYFTSSYEAVIAYSSFTPQVTSLPSENVANTTSGSDFSWYTEGYGTKLGSGTTGKDSFTVTQNIVVDVFYPLRTYTVWVHHVTENDWSIFKSEPTVIVYGSTFTPITTTPPTGNTTSGSWFKWWTNDYGTILGTGTTGTDPIAVTQDLVVEIYYPLCTYTLTISQGVGSIVTVKRDSEILTNGAAITYGDMLTISFGVKEGYNLISHTVNNSTFTSGGSHTVAGAVVVIVTAFLRAYQIGDKLYHAYIGNKKYTAYIGGSDGKPVPYGNIKPMENN